MKCKQKLTVVECFRMIKNSKTKSSHEWTTIFIESGIPIDEIISQYVGEREESEFFMLNTINQR